MALLVEMRDKYNIGDKVELLGSLHHNKVRDVLCRGHIFLNTSLTEAFCIAILEAASCGLLCVSTNVGGIPEVLPPDMIQLAPARPKPMIEKLELAISKTRNIQSTKMHETVKKLYFMAYQEKLYSWHSVAEKTEKVYQEVIKMPRLTLLSKLKMRLAFGPIVGIIAVCMYFLHMIVALILEFLLPFQNIDLAEEFDQNIYKDNPEKFGDH